MRFLSSRPFFFVLAVLVHLLAFWLLSGLKFFSNEAPPESQEPQFTLVKTAPAPVPPPPPSGTEAGGMSMPSAMVAPVPTVATVAPITTFNPVAFNMPKPELPSMNDLPVLQTASIAPGIDNGAGTGGDGQGASLGSGRGYALTGMTIDAQEKLFVVVDHSPSMSPFYDAITNTLKNKFRDAPVIPIGSCKGDADYEHGNAVDKYNKLRGTPIGNGEANSLYVGMYWGLMHAPDSTAIYIITDFEDGDEPESTTDMISTLKAMHIKLYICSVEKEPYGALADYAKESGGGYVLMPSNEALASFKPGIH